MYLYGEKYNLRSLGTEGQQDKVNYQLKTLRYNGNLFSSWVWYEV